MQLTSFYAIAGATKNGRSRRQRFHLALTAHRNAATSRNVNTSGNLCDAPRLTTDAFLPGLVRGCVGFVRVFVARIQSRHSQNEA
jgi:hypothetical protein